MKEFYEKLDLFNNPITTRNLKILERCYIKLQNLEHPRILDIGCGNGWYCTSLREFFPNMHYCGLDINDKDDVKDVFDDFYLVDLNSDKELQELTLNNSDFDIIICSEVLEHLFNPEYIYTFIADNLKENGIAIVTTPNLDWAMRELCPDELLYNHEIPHIKQHIRQFNLATHRKYLTSNSVRIIEVFGADSEYCEISNTVVTKIREKYPECNPITLHRALQEVLAEYQHTIGVVAELE